MDGLFDGQGVEWSDLARLRSLQNQQKILDELKRQNAASARPSPSSSVGSAGLPIPQGLILHFGTLAAAKSKASKALQEEQARATRVTAIRDFYTLLAATPLPPFAMTLILSVVASVAVAVASVAAAGFSASSALWLAMLGIAAGVIGSLLIAVINPDELEESLASTQESVERYAASINEIESQMQRTREQVSHHALMHGFGEHHFEALLVEQSRAHS